MQQYQTTTNQKTNKQHLFINSKILNNTLIKIILIKTSYKLKKKTINLTSKIKTNLPNLKLSTSSQNSLQISKKKKIISSKF